MTLSATPPSPSPPPPPPPPCACWRLCTFVKYKKIPKKPQIWRGIRPGWKFTHAFKEEPCRVYVVGEFPPIPVVAELENWRAGMGCADGSQCVNNGEKPDPLWLTVNRFGLAVRLVSRTASARFRFGSPFSSERLWFVHTVLWLCPSQLMKR